MIVSEDLMVLADSVHILWLSDLMIVPHIMIVESSDKWRPRNMSDTALSDTALYDTARSNTELSNTALSNTAM